MGDHNPAPSGDSAALRKVRPTLARVTLWTGDAARLEAFYAGVFGFKSVYRHTLAPTPESQMIISSWHLDPGAGMEIILMRSPRGDTELGITAATGQKLGERPTARDAPPTIGMAYIVLYVPDLDAVIARAKALNTTFAREPKRVSTADGTTFYEMALYDPDGTTLLVVEDIIRA